MKRSTASKPKAKNKKEIPTEKVEEAVKNEAPKESEEESEEGLAFNADEFLLALQGQEPEEPIEKRIETSYIQRSQTGRGLFKLHGKTTSKRIFW